jgi:hypothetical protein
MFPWSHSGATRSDAVKADPSYYCSGSRWWIKRALFADAGDFFRFPPNEEDDDQEDED